MSLQGHFAYLIVDTYFLLFYVLAFIIYVLTLYTYIFFTVFGYLEVLSLNNCSIKLNGESGR